MEREWLTVKEAWALYGAWNVETFRRKICSPGGVLDQRHGLRVRKGQRRVILVSRTVLLALVEEERGEAG